MSNPENYTVGWICAISTEYVAAQAFLDERHDGPEYVSPRDNNHYTLGQIGKHNVVMAVLPDGEYGISSAAGVAKDMLQSFPNVRIGLMVGIGGGAPSAKHDIRLGDIVVSASRDGRGALFQYDFGKAIQGQDFQETAVLNQPPIVLRTAVSGLQAHYEAEGHRLGEVIDEILQKKPRLRKKYKRPDPNTDTLYKSGFTHPGSNNSSCAVACGNDQSCIIRRAERTEDEDNPAIHYGRIASANTLMKDALVRDTLAATRDVLCFEMEAAGLANHFPCLVVRGICDYSDTHKNMEWQGYAAMAAAAYTKDLLRQIPRNRLEAEERISKLLSSVLESVSQFGEVVTNIVSTTTEVNDRVQDLRTVLLHARLEREVAAGASFDSRAEQHSPRCLPNTRVELLQDISIWATDPSSEAIFWLNGMAGTGKSTVSRTLAQLFASQNHLGASFFFKRGETDRGSMSKLFSTIAADLVRSQPATARHINSAIDSDPRILRKAMPEQFEKLILGPISEISLTLQRPEPIIIIVDALDECEQEDDIKLLIHLFSRARTPQTVQLKVFLTSRPDLPIRLGFKAIKGNYRGLILHEIPEPVVEHDIRAFLEHELARIRGEYNAVAAEDRQLAEGWPGPSNVETLVKMAIPLFIFAATVCLFIADRRVGTPDKQLKRVLLPRAGGRLSQLARTYMPVLENQVAGLSDDERQEVIQEFRKIVGSIVILARPLSTSTLARILDITGDDVEGRLYMLHSVLSVPSSREAPVRLLHLSFRDYLLDPKQQEVNAFWIDEKQTHHAMAVHCLSVMESLREDICDIEAPGTTRSDIDPHKVDASLPTEVQYACVYWVYHLQGAGAYDGDCEQVYSFLKHHFLHWIEALSLIGRAWESVHLTQTLQSLYKYRGGNQLSQFLDDGAHFVLANTSVIDCTPLQIYSSLLLFSPARSKIRATFWSEVPRWITLRPNVKDDWALGLQILEGHSSRVSSVVFAPNGALVASGSSDRTIRLWSTTTGECVRTLQGHVDAVNSVSFSHDSTMIASGSDDMTIRFWCVTTGECVRMLKDCSDRITSVAFSSDSSLMVSGSMAKTVQLWRVATSQRMQTLESHGDIANTADPSNNSPLMASGSEAVQLWRAATVECKQTIEGHDQPVNSVAFSPSEDLIASASWDKTIQLWSVTTGECVHTLQGHSSGVSSVAFSPNATLLASGSWDKTVRLWRLRATTVNAENVHVLHSGTQVLSVTFSHDSSLVASSSCDETIRLWRVGSGECVRSLRGHSNWIMSVAFSRDSALIASGYSDSTVRLWRATTTGCMQAPHCHDDIVNTVSPSPNSLSISSNFEAVQLWRAVSGERPRTPEGHEDRVSSVAFSPAGKLVVSSSWDQTVRLWSVLTGECVQTLLGHSHGVSSVVFSPNGELVASGSSDRTIRLWRVTTGACVQTLRGHEDIVNSVVFSPNSTMLASGSDDKTIRIWEVVTGNCVKTLKGPNWVFVVTLSFNSEMVASGADNGTIRVWQVETGQCAQMLKGHDNYVTAVAFSHNSTLVASGSSDNTIRLWHVATGNCLQVLDVGFESSILSFEAGNAYLLTDHGALAIQVTECSPTESLAHAMPDCGFICGLTRDSCWITWNQERLLWLPKEYRPSVSAISGTVVAFGCYRGVILVGLSRHEVGKFSPK